VGRQLVNQSKRQFVTPNHFTQTGYPIDSKGQKS
jgi:hypothetical protein